MRISSNRTDHEIYNKMQCNFVTAIKMKEDPPPHVSSSFSETSKKEEEEYSFQNFSTLL